ncbi:hypothetical protein JCM16161A_20060 [Vulcanisaeta sp. JCM 16161]|uniref:hypothetical protein n=1 Tax=Vulcanisaeta sp. JCM 16161 TaxID=1295372 RepID=UPI0006D0A053|nr:hypothetical protein [Vulcanisaeta sp. JCM 16161]
MATRDELKKAILELIRTDEEFRLAVAGALGLDTILNELKALRQDFNAMLSRVINIESKVTNIENRVTSIENRATGLEGRVTGIEDK